MELRCKSELRVSRKQNIPRGAGVLTFPDTGAKEEKQSINTTSVSDIFPKEQLQ